MKTKSLLIGVILGGSLALSAAQASDEPPIRALLKAEGWINGPPQGASQLRGKVVLVDFWTYTCVNWIRTLPYVRAWAEKYKNQGLVVVGVHSPEFEFEADIRNVRAAANALRVDYPIAVDSHHAVWNAYGNEYWPALYLVDTDGRIRLRHFGEGDYSRIETIIQQLLAEAGNQVTSALVSVAPQGVEAAADWDNLRSPENYLGLERTLNFASVGKAIDSQSRAYQVPATLRLNQWALSGIWTLTADAARLDRGNGRIAYRFHARDVNLVMGAQTRTHPVKFRVLIDGQPPGAAHGIDVDEQGFGVVDEPRLYQLIRQDGAIVDRQVEIEFMDKGVQAFSFTFG